jgi:Putative MetA-pathway of phenol degradation
MGNIGLRRLSLVTLLAAGFGGWFRADDARAQDMEPRAYSANPVGMNFLLARYTYTWGSLSFDPSLPITGVEAGIHSGSLGYERTFDLLGRTASAAVLLPYIHGNVSGDVFEQSREVSRSGLGDLAMRFAVNLIGGPALTPRQFVHRKPSTTLGTSLTIVAPTGNYDSSHLINIGSHRWAFKPEIGLSQPFGRWFADASAGAWFYTDNNDFFNGHRRGEQPIATFQVHLGYNFAPGFWLAGDATYYTGGETSRDGVADQDVQSVTRAGLTLSVPLSDAFSAKLSWATWLTAHNGGTFNTVGLTLQYRWF